ncbi:hypothetical protein HPP92_008615 [Vanilla planifolia]|uniref:Uncharacterized protein n=1 Tax=Vanilla planifolia TaxID=51239 RepID=A0A835R2T0_VANPL|nr:hypothetical protein HPP92_008615 [Vanilla planifolia]
MEKKHINKKKKKKKKEKNKKKNVKKWSPKVKVDAYKLLLDKEYSSLKQVSRVKWLECWRGMISIKDSEDYQASRGEGFQQAGEESSANSEKSNKMTVEKLMEAYEKCIPGLRKSQAKRRSLSLRKIAPASFSKEARLEVPESVIQKMLSLNNLDVELYQHAQHLFMQQQKQLQNDGVKIEHLSVQGARQIGHILYGWGSTKLLLLGLMTLTVVFTSMIVTKKRRMSKLKVASQLAGDTASQGNGLTLSSIPDIAIPDMFGQSAFDLKGQRKGLKFWLSISISVQFLKIDFL